VFYWCIWYPLTWISTIWNVSELTSEFRTLFLFEKLNPEKDLHEHSMYLWFIFISLCCNRAPHHSGVLGEWTYSSTHSLASALVEGEWSALRPGRFTPKERAPRTHWIGGWVGPGAVLDAVVKRKIPSPRRESNPRTPIVQPVLQRYTNWAITAFAYSYHSLYLYLHWIVRYSRHTGM
jgi:hypothetical protein